ncbi:MAG TPA: phosphotransferase family protein [Acidimicrobiales bacterium]|nr:phosphotransferase family protein [Acidimicrobiales bacterium]
MSGIARVDVATLTVGLDAWLEQWEPARRAGAQIHRLERPASGWSSDTLLTTVHPPIDVLANRQPVTELVFRVAPPAAVASFPMDDFAPQAAVIGSLPSAGLPAPTVLAVEDDRQWLGAPFLVMTRSPGRAVGDAPALDPWLIGLPSTTQRRIHEGYLDALAAIHRFDWHDAKLDGVLRQAGPDLKAEFAWWSAYIDWASEGTPAPELDGHLQWCIDTAPFMAHPPSLCWGDARLGNVLLREDGSIGALLDWELASIGPPEADLAWYLALDRLTTRVVGRSVPGFLARDDAISRYQDHLGRPVEHLDWHEIFALVRSVAINERQARLAAAGGVPYPGIPGKDNPMLDYIRRRIQRFETLA